MTPIITFAAAISFGISAALVLAFVCRALSGIVGQPPEGGAAEDNRRNLPILFRVLLPIVPAVRGIAESNAMETFRKAAEPRLWMGGYGETLVVADYLGIRILCFGIGLIFQVAGGVTGHAVIGLLMMLMMFIYPEVWLSGRIRRRHLEILKALPNVLDLLTLSVEAGKDFLTSLRDILARRRLDSLGEELMRAFHEIQLGRKRADALRDMSKRVRQPDLAAVVNAIVQAEELGVSIGQLLRLQGDMLRNKRFNLAEKLANEAPVKIIIPIILFIFPAVIIILAVPIMLKIFQVFH
jgi:tight adherence protein C